LIEEMGHMRATASARERPPRTGRILIIDDIAPSSAAMRELLRMVERVIYTTGGTTARWASASTEWLDRGAGAADERDDRLRVAAQAADSLVLVASVRHNSYSGALKLALDQLETRDVRAKPVGLVSVGQVYSTQALEHLRVVMGALGTVVIPQHVIAVDADFQGPASQLGSATPQLVERVGQFIAALGWFTARLQPQASGHRPPGRSVADEAHGGHVVPPARDRELSPSISRAVAYLRENFSNHDLTLDLTARVAHLSRYHFSRTFKKQTGQRFIDFLTTLRMAEAKSLLSATDLPVTEVCRRVGYHESSHFQRTFKSSFGVSPSQYRVRCEPACQRI
jgi:AraC-like DNA-binding protein/NAD(P)H-dependent FMN reductase